MPSLMFDHEEADIRIFLHVNDALDEYEKKVIKDVFVLAFSYPHSISSEIYLSIGTSINPKEVNATAVSQTMTLRCCSALLGYHVFSSCHSASAFRYKGKAKWFDLMF